MIARKLRGIKEIEKTSEHIDIIMLFTPKRLLTIVAIGTNATWHMQLPMNAKQCAERRTHLFKVI